MNKTDFYFDLPERLIAQTPLEKRDTSRLLHLDKLTGEIEHRHFYDIKQYLRKGDCLVLNDSRVLPARLIGARPTGGSVELVLLKDLGDGCWECLSRPGRKTKPGQEIIFGNGELTATVQSVTEGGNRIVKFHFEGVFLEVLEGLGKMPLPPYIKEELKDSERYQTVYSKELGSAAAPTAGLHFTDGLIASIRAKGVLFEHLTLDVGVGTFRPIQTDTLDAHVMHSEHYVISEALSAAIAETRERGGRVIAVGTTVVRSLEDQFDRFGGVRPGAYDTNIFLRPGRRFGIVDAMVTNFHLPGSTLMVLVSAFAGYEAIMSAYREAVERGYMFYSYGDAMFLERGASGA